jgi:hypothetical protein
MFDYFRSLLRSQESTPPPTRKAKIDILERIPVMFERSLRGAGNSCILWG